MTTYFTQSNIMKRFFFLVGKTKDTFVDESLASYDLEYMVFDHLKKLGYERIMFYGKVQKLFCYDEHSYQLILNSTQGQSQSAPKKPMLTSGPLSGRLLGQQAPQATSKPIPPNVLHFGKMNDLDAFQRIDYCMHDKRHKTAVIFNNAEDFMAFFGQVRTDRGSESIQSKVYDSINNYDGLPFDNSNIMLFMFPQRSLSETMSIYGNMNGLWHVFFQPRMGKGNVIEIGAPAQAEIRNAINLIRITHGISVDFQNLDKISKMLAKSAFANSLTLTELMRHMMACAYNRQVLNLEATERICGKSNRKGAFERLDELIGMDSVKQQIHALEMRSKHMAETVDFGYVPRIQPQPKQPRAGMNLHFVLTGNPGTGKTTVARLLGEIYYELGFLPGGHTVKVTRSDLVAAYVGQTAIKTRACIDRAIGGVLFVDEAYTLKRVHEEGMSDNDFGQEAIDTILEAMSDRAGEFAVVVAGYPKEMQGFLNSNPGLQRRFNQTIHIDDYSPEELREIFDMNCRNKRYAIDGYLEKGMNDFFVNWHRSRDNNWGNAGNVEKLLDSMYERWCMRSGARNTDGALLLSQCDVPESLQIHFKDITEAKQDAITRLDSLIGLHNVKDRIKKLRRNIRIGGYTSEPGHYVFAGNPGTGKTTVARLLGDLMCEAGVLRRGHVVEVSREDLVSVHVGATAPKTKAVIDRALDGVLFIDEAYRLVDGGEGSANNFGLEAIDTLVAAMENNRERLCVICAGYTSPMEEFVQCNPGLKSRFTEVIEFEDYTANELLEILVSFAGRENTLQAEFLEKSRRIFEHWVSYKTADFGNARDVRKFFAQCRDTLYARLEKEYPDYDIPDAERHTYTATDIPKEFEKLGVKKGDAPEIPLVCADRISSQNTSFDYEEDFGRVESALLLIQVHTERGDRYGSGFIVTPDGYAFTCHHVIENAESIQVRVRGPGQIGGEGSWYKATVVKTDKNIDIALIKIEGKNFSAMPIAPREHCAHPGHDIALLGYPFGANLADDINQLNASLFVGRISSSQIVQGYERLYVDVQAKRGNSGGPVINQKTGLVVGILCGSQAEGNSRLVEELNYIRPAKYIWETFVEENK